MTNENQTLTVFTCSSYLCARVFSASFHKGQIKAQDRRGKNLLYCSVLYYLLKFKKAKIGCCCGVIFVPFPCRSLPVDCPSLLIRIAIALSFPTRLASVLSLCCLQSTGCCRYWRVLEEVVPKPRRIQRRTREALEMWPSKEEKPFGKIPLERQFSR